jgi:hypothetical protein
VFAAGASREDDDVAADSGIALAGTDSPVPLRPLQVRELIDLPFALIQANIRLLAGFTFGTLLLAELGAVGVAVATDLPDGSDFPWIPVLATVFLAWLARMFLRAVTTVIGVDAVLRPDSGRRAGIRSTVRQCARRAVPLFVATLAQTVLALATLALTVVVAALFPPALAALGWVRARWSLVPSVIVAEQLSYRAAAARSVLLVRPAFGALGRQWLAHRLVLLVALLPMAGASVFIVTTADAH